MPLTMQNVIDARRTWARPAFEKLQEHFERTAADIARDVGYGDPNGRGSINRPVRERYHTTDGKVTAVRGSPYRTGPTRSGLKGGPQPTATNCRPTTAAASQAASPTTPPSKRPPVGLVGHVPHPCPSVTDAQA
jgi:hypothetical protein